MKKIIVFILLLSGLCSFAQVKTYDLSSNKHIESFLDQNPDYKWQSDVKTKWGVKDTLALPFFDDFSQSSLYPDSSLWLNNQVYVNNHFAKWPPTLGVATFDVLDSKGQPYNATINKDFKSSGDSLLSQPINLLDSAGRLYTLDDSMVFSFFIQPNGYGYHLNSEDSIKLFFKNKFDSWVQVWARGGSEDTEPFELVMLKIEEEGYFHSGFQFLFTTYTRQVGNANHWHLDYVMLDKNRSILDDFFQDYAIQTIPSPLLKNYYQMPFSHFMVNPASETADSLYVRASNLDSVKLNIQVRHTESFDGNQLVATTYSSNAANISPRNSTLRRVDDYNFYSTLSGPLPVVIDRKFEIREFGVINSYTDNDVVETTQQFFDYFAHDDGSAEQGFGFDHETNPSNIPGEIAYRFEMKKEDTLYAIATFFNQAVFDVRSELFTFRVWQSIKGPDQVEEDVLLYESEPLNPHYMDRINRFSVHYLDTNLVLPAGDFYIGWYQSSMYNLNVGWDRNSGNVKDPDVTSSNLYYKVFGTWSNNNLPYGELMMRPYVGSEREVFAAVTELERTKELTFYPNPATDKIHFNEEMKQVLIYNNTGQIVAQLQDVSSADLAEFPNGIYFIKACNSSDLWLNSKLVIFAP